MFSYSLRLFDILLHRDSSGIPQEALREAKTRYAQFLQDDVVTQDVIDEAMIHFGLASWEYWEAEEEFMELYGREKEKELFLSSLSDSLRDTWHQYESQLHGEAVYDHDDAFEGTFSAEEHYALEEAVVLAKEKVIGYVRSLASVEKADEYMQLVIKFRKEKEEILSLLEQLSLMKDQLPDNFDEEIDTFVHYVKQGFAEIEQRPLATVVQGNIDFYRSKLVSLETNK